jgi:hypothetical protein
MCLHFRAWTYLTPHHRICKKCGTLQRASWQGPIPDWTFNNWIGSLESFKADAIKHERLLKEDLMKEMFQTQEKIVAKQYVTSSNKNGDNK